MRLESICDVMQYVSDSPMLCLILLVVLEMASVPMRSQALGSRVGGCQSECR